MKDFRKNKQGLFICEECGRTFKICSNLSAHIGIIHDKKEYYDKWLKEENEGFCIICKKETIFNNNFKRGYKKTCSKKCLAKSRSYKPSEETLKKREATLIKRYGVNLSSRITGFKEKINQKFSLKTPQEKEKIIKKRKNTCLKYYGVEHVSQLEENKQKAKKTKLEKYGDENYVNKDKIKETKLKHYGDENYVNIEKGKKTKLEKYGDENYVNKDKIKQTKLLKYGNENFNNREKYKKTCIEKFEVENPSQSKEIKKKKVKTCLKHYGVEYPIQSKKIIKKIKLTNNKKYGYDNVFQSNIIKEKIKETCLERYGVIHNLSSKKIRKQIKQTKLKLYDNENYTNRKKSKQTCLKHYGVEYPLQNREIFEKAQKTRFLRKQFRDTKIWYQGSYELDFLEKYYDKYPDITRGPRIKYIFEDKEHYYFSDFLILSKNLVVECKNSYLAKKDKLVLKEKKKATKKQDFKWIMIIDKNYSKFELQL